MKHAWMDAPRREFALSERCEALKGEYPRLPSLEARRGGAAQATDGPADGALIQALHAELQGA